MSFVKKTLKKAWNFVKKNWKTIVLVAAVAFTAGVATIGFAAFSGVTGVGSFMSAVGSTMWAGVAGTMGTMGIGQGAAVPAGSALAEAGVTHVGLGAAWGAGAEVGATGMSAGWGKAGSTAVQQAATHSAVQASDAAVVAEAAASGMSPSQAAIEAGREAAIKSSVTEAGKAGLSDAAWKTMGVAAPIAGAFLTAAGQPSEHKKTGFWGVDPDSTEFGPGVNALEDPSAPGDEQIAAATSGPGGGAADALMQTQMNRAQESISRPLMGQGGTGRNPDGTVKQPGFGGLMDQEDYRYG